MTPEAHIQLIHGDCLEVMGHIPDGSVDLILCDLPYQMIDCAWDKKLPFDALWAHYKRVIKPNGAIILTACQPFTTELINSQRQLFRYSLVWEKTRKVGFLNARKMPLRTHEDILVFYKRLPTYNPQGVKPFTGTRQQGKASRAYNYADKKNHRQENTGFPSSVLKIPSEPSPYHPTQKPVALMGYLIQTYTHTGEVVLDNCMGSGTTGVACLNTGRRFIGIEKDTPYFNIAQERLRATNAGGGVNA